MLEQQDIGCVFEFLGKRPFILTFAFHGNMIEFDKFSGLRR